MNRDLVLSVNAVLDVRYQLWDPNTNPVLKIAQALASVDSEYSVICADDDFIVPRAADQCMQLLDGNTDYVVAHGRTVSVFPVPDSSKGFRSRLWTYYLPQQSIDGVDARYRLRQHLGSYRATFYSVHRRLDLMRNMQLTSRITGGYRFAELYSSCLSVIHGKSAYLDIPYYIRPRHPNSWGQVTPSWSSLLGSDDYSRRFVEFRDSLADELANVTGLSATEARDFVEDAFLSYLAHAWNDTSRDSVGHGGLDAMQRAARQVWSRISGVMTPLVQRGLAIMVQTILETPTRAYIEQNLSRKQGYMSIQELLDPGSPFRADFLPICEQLIRYPCVPG